MSADGRDRRNPKKLALLPAHPERVCWGCERHCPWNDLACGNGSERTMHPVELFGEDWYEWSQELLAASASRDAE